MKITRLTQVEEMFVKKHPGGSVWRDGAKCYAVVYSPGGKVYRYSEDNLPRLAARLELISKVDAERMLGWKTFPCGCIGRLEDTHCRIHNPTQEDAEMARLWTGR